MLFINQWRGVATIVSLTFFLSDVFGQFADRCFESVSPTGFFHDSGDIVNLCGKCGDNSIGADLIQWDGEQWQGQRSTLHRKPPPGCNMRGFWLGWDGWTRGGEGIGLRLSQSLIAGREYSITITYAKDGNNLPQSGGFSPILYVSQSNPPRYITQSEKIGRFQATDDWKTDTFTFTAGREHGGAQWIILHAFEVSGIVLSMCIDQHPIKRLALKSDTVVCQEKQFLLSVDEMSNYAYTWSTGETGNLLRVTAPGSYSITISNSVCEYKDSINVLYKDCEARLDMPNVFTPNRDAFNNEFVPMSSNYIKSAALRVFDRWGGEIFSGDVFKGWDGGDADSGIYYYQVFYVDEENRRYQTKGWVSLSR
jgi:gliding motility-associated-like protein